MEGASLHCSRRPWTRHGPWGPLIHHGCPSPRIYHGRLNSLTRFLKPNVLSLPLVSPYPLGPSLGQGSLLRPGGRLSRLLRPGGRLSRLLRPGGRLSRLLRPGGRLICQSHSTSPSTCQSHSTSPPTCQSHPTSPRTCQSHPTSPPTCQSHPTSPLTCQSHLTPPLTCQSHLTPPLTCQSHLTSPLTCQSHLTPPLTCQSHLTPPLTCQSHLTPPLTCQSHLTPPLTCQSHLTPPLTCQSHLTSLLSRPPCPGGLLFHWPHMDLALRPLPRFHLRSTALLDFALCKRLEAALWGGALSWIWLPLTQTAHHPWTTSPSMHCTHTFPSTITPITQLSPFTHQPWLPHHTCTSFTHSHKSSTQTLTHCEVLFCPGYISERSSPYLLSLCVTPDCPTYDLWTCACDLDPCLVLFTSLLCLWSSCFCLLTIACLILPPLNKYWCNWIRMPQTPSLHLPWWYLL